MKCRSFKSLLHFSVDVNSKYQSLWNVFVLSSLLNTIDVIRHNLNTIITSLVSLHCEMKQFGFVMYNLWWLQNHNLRVYLHERYLQVTNILSFRKNLLPVFEIKSLESAMFDGKSLGSVELRKLHIFFIFLFNTVIVIFWPY